MALATRLPRSTAASRSLVGIRGIVGA